MRTPVPKLIRRPSRSTPSVILALLLLTAGGLGAWLAGHRIFTGTWPDRTVTTLDTIGSATLGSVAVLAAAGIAAACALAMILAALWPGLPSASRSSPTPSQASTAVRRHDLAALVRNQVRADRRRPLRHRHHPSLPGRRRRPQCPGRPQPGAGSRP